jgi:hypothetical protein
MKWGPWVVAGLLAIAIVWFSWMFRYEQFRGAPWYFLDRWTGELVYADGTELERISLRRAPAAKGNPFSDLIPARPGRFRAD